MCRDSNALTRSFEDAIQERVRIVVTDCICSGEHWTEVRLAPPTMLFDLARFEEWPDRIEGECDGYTYRATPTVNDARTLVTFELEVVL